MTFSNAPYGLPGNSLSRGRSADAVITIVGSAGTALKGVAMKQMRPGILFIIFAAWLVINIRVEAGMASTLERALDGLAGGVVLLVAVFAALRFFKCGD